MEDRVAGADLRMGRFQFDFDQEEDIIEVMKMEPFHFDYWMLALVRWEPKVELSYPCEIPFWIRVLGVPLHFWAEPTFRAIGEALGRVEEGDDAVDSIKGMVRVTIDGFNPFFFETTVEFYGGEEITVTLRYERLFGYCRRCFSLCHEASECPSHGGNGSRRDNQPQRDTGSEQMNLSYRGAVTGANNGSSSGFNQGAAGKSKGKRPVFEVQEKLEQHMNRDNWISFKAKQGQRFGGESSRNGKATRHTGGVEYKKRFAVSTEVLQNVTKPEYNHLSVYEQTMLSAYLGENGTEKKSVKHAKTMKGGKTRSSRQRSVTGKPVRKTLNFESNLQSVAVGTEDSVEEETVMGTDTVMGGLELGELELSGQIEEKNLFASEVVTENVEHIMEEQTD